MWACGKWYITACYQVEKDYLRIYLTYSKFMKQKIWNFACGFIILTLLLTSCSAPKELEYRSYKNFRVEKLGLGYSTVRLELVYFNPNKFGLQLKRTDLDIYIDDVYFGRTSQDLQITIPRESEFSLPIKIDLDMKNLFKNALTTGFSKSVDIKVKGTVKVGKANIFKSFPVNYEGIHNLSVF